MMFLNALKPDVATIIIFITVAGVIAMTFIQSFKKKNVTVSAFLVFFGLTCAVATLIQSIKNNLQQQSIQDSLNLTNRLTELNNKFSSRIDSEGYG